MHTERSLLPEDAGFPATVKTILQWLASIAPKVKPDTAKSYLNSLRSYHTDQRWDTTIFSDPHIDLLIRGAKRCFPEKQKRTRLPLRHTPTNYPNMLSQFN